MAEADGGPWIVLGLGNPDDEYGGSRHNAGAMVVALLAARRRVLHPPPFRAICPFTSPNHAAVGRAYGRNFSSRPCSSL